MKIKLPNEVKIYYEKFGQGLPLLMLHGNGDSLQDLKILGKALSKNYTVYLIDSRGHGKSSHHNKSLTYEDLAQDINFFIDELKLTDVNIIGHSDGAIIATLLAISQKSYLRKIILLGLTLKPELMKLKWTKWILDEYEKQQHPLFKLMIQEPQIEFEDLKVITIPTLVVAAEDDVMVKELYIKTASEIPLGELYIVDNENHASYVVNTDKFYNKAILFLK